MTNILPDIEQLHIDLFEGLDEDAYNKVKIKFIAEHWTKDNIKAEHSWNEQYEDFEDWKGKQKSLNAHGQQAVIDKINEIVERVNQLSS